MTPFEALSGTMDAQVDSHLGDSISYRTAPAGDPLQDEAGNPTIPGFVFLNNDSAFADGITPQRQRWFAKVHVRYLPGGPQIAHRLDNRRLPGTMRPATDTRDRDGDYWLFELQRA